VGENTLQHSSTEVYFIPNTPEGINLNLYPEESILREKLTLSELTIINDELVSLGEMYCQFYGPDLNAITPIKSDLTCELPNVLSVLEKDCRTV
jgi:hypothetical protein